MIEGVRIVWASQPGRKQDAVPLVATDEETGRPGTWVWRPNAASMGRDNWVVRLNARDIKQCELQVARRQSIVKGAAMLRAFVPWPKVHKPTACERGKVR